MLLQKAFQYNDSLFPMDVVKRCIIFGTRREFGEKVQSNTLLNTASGLDLTTCCSIPNKARAYES